MNKKLLSLMLVVCMVVSMIPTFTIQADAAAAAGADAKQTYSFITVSSEWTTTTETQSNPTRTSANDLRDITYDYTDGNWAYGATSVTGNSTLRRAILKSARYLNCNVPNGKWIAFKIKAPVSGLYATAMTYTERNLTTAGASDVYIVPMGDIETLISTDEYKIGTISYKGDKTNYTALTELGTAWLDEGENYLVLKSVGTGTNLTPVSFSINGENKLSNIEVSLGKSELKMNESTYVSSKISFMDGTELSPEECPVWYTSSDTNVATVDAYGKVTAVGIGTAEITVNAIYEGANVTKGTTVTVTDDSTYTSLEIVAPESMYVGQSVRAEIYLRTENGAKVSVWDIEEENTVKVSSNDENILFASTVASLAARSEGKATLSVSVTIGETVFEDTADISVIAEMSKTEPTIYTYAKRDAAIENISKYEWAKEIRDKAVKNAEKYVDNFERYYDAITGQEIPRSGYPSLRNDANMYMCRFCGENLQRLYGQYAWEIDVVNTPWKIKCPACERLFPSNDFESFYKLGLDENGCFDRLRALEAHRAMLLEKGLLDESITDPGEEHSVAWKAYYGYGVSGGYLCNDLYNDLESVATINCGTGLREGETTATWAVDDGFGYVPAMEDGTGYSGSNGVQEIHAYIPCYSFELWNELNEAIVALRDAYLYTNNERYGIAGAILLDGMADVFPGFDTYTYYSAYGKDYYLADGNAKRGKVLGRISDRTLATAMARASDAFFPVISDKEVINFLSGKALAKENGKDKSSGIAIWNNWSENILLEIYDAVKSVKIYGNFGQHQETVAAAAIALDAEPKKSEMIDWIFKGKKENLSASATSNSGGDFDSMLIDTIDRDGIGQENSVSYNNIYINGLLNSIELLENEERSLINHPKIKAMFTTEIPLVLSGNHHAQIGDSQSTASIDFAGTVDTTIKGFKFYGTHELAQYIYLLNGFSVDGLHYDIFEKNPERIKEEVLRYRDEKSVIKSEMITGFGYAVLRGGDGTDRINARTNLADFWIYFGKSGTHGHLDALNIGIEAFGLNLAPDLGYPEATGYDPNRLQWLKATISHNTVVVDDDSQPESLKTALPMHFDASDKVKVVDIDASENYSQTKDYRRTLIMVDAGDDVSYGIDFFRVKGGNKHTFSFHSQAENAYPIEGIEMTAQTDEGGNYVGTYAGADVPYGPDPNTKTSLYYETLYPRGYTWLKNVRRDVTPQNSFAVEFDVKDYRESISDSNGIKLRLTQFDNFTPSEVAIAAGHVPQTANNAALPESLDYLLVQREGDNLDSLFTTVYEPYKGKRYIKSIEQVNVTREAGNTSINDKVSALKVTHITGKVDYIVYATNGEALYNVDNTFLFSGFVGVYSLDENGNCTYRYVNHGEVIGDATGEVKEYSGKVLGFTRTLSENSYIDIDASCENPSELSGKYIYIGNDEEENGVYRIERAEKTDAGVRLFTESTLIREHKNPDDVSAGYIYNIAVGQKFVIPMAFESKELFVKSENPEATSISLLYNALALAPRESKKLSAKISPITAENAALVWSSSDENVATVDENGRITAVSAGTAEIRATATNGVYGACSVTVTDVPLSEDGEWAYAEYEDGVELIKYFGDDFDVTVPAVIVDENGIQRNVLRLGKDVFKNNLVIESVTLNEGIKEIGESAFEGAEYLVCAFIPDSLIKIDKNAFYGCSKFNSVILYSTVKTIGTNAFAKCPVLVMYCESNSEAHKHAKYDKINFKLMGTSVPKVEVVDGVTYYVMGGAAYAVHFDGVKRSIEIPETVLDCPVVSIGEVFRESRITSISLPETVTTIDPYAFYGCTALNTVSLPSEIATIGRYAFYNCKSMTAIDIPAGVSVLPEYVFYGCEWLSSVTLPEKLTGIGNYAFYNCERISLSSLPENVTSIGAYSFYDCFGISNIELPQSLISIGAYAFENCRNILNITVPGSVKVVDVGTFSGCAKLSKVILSPGVETVKSSAFRNCTSLKEVKLYDGILSISSAFVGCTSLSSITLPSTLINLTGSAFENTALTTVIVPQSVVSISENALPKTTVWVVYENSAAHIKAREYGALYVLYGSDAFSLETYVENGVTYVVLDGKASATAFDGSVTEVTVPENINGYPVTDINQAFKGSAITSIVLPSSVSKIENGAFEGCKDLLSADLGEGIKEIEERAFYGCSSLQNIKIGVGVLSIGNYAFFGCSQLASIELPDTLTKIGSYAFTNCSKLTSVTIPSSVEDIGNYAFRNCHGLSELTLSAGIKNIGTYAFANCLKLSAVEVPSSVETIEKGAFSGCTTLSNVILNEGISSVGDLAFENCNAVAQMLLPESITSISAASVSPKTIWVVHENSFVHKRAEEYGALYMLYGKGTEIYDSTITENGITYVVSGEKATAIDFDGSVTSVVVPSEVGGYPVVDIGTAFSKKAKLLSIVIPETVKVIKYGAFKGCTKLKTVSLPESIVSIGNNAFENCSSLVKINLPDTVSAIGAYAFSNCTALARIDLPEGLETIGERAFSYCTSLESVRIPKGVTSFGEHAFSSCTGLTQIDIADGITKLGSYAFYNCTKLETVQIPSSVVTIEEYAFSGCKNILKVLIPATVESIDKTSFNSNTLWLVYERSNAHAYAESVKQLHFLINKTYIPEIAYGAGISGTVTLDGAPASGAEVELLYDDGVVKETVTTDANGAYSFTYAEVGAYTIRAKYAGTSGTEKVSVKRMNIFDVFLAGETDIVLKGAYTVSGMVSPASATVTLTDTDGNIIETVTVTDGAYSFTNVPNGSYIVKAETANGTSAKEITVFNADVTVDGIVIEAVSTATITGTVDIEDREGGRHKKIWVNVSLYNEEGIEVAQTKTKEDGTYTFGNVSIGKYSLVAETEEMRPDKKHKFDRGHKIAGYAYVEITEAATYTVDITGYEENDSLATISGKVTAQGETQNCEVILTNVFRHEVAKCTTGNNGKYTFKNVRDGMYFITARTQSDGMGFAVVVVRNGKVYGETDIFVLKPDKIHERENNFPRYETEDDVRNHRDRIAEEKRWYDSLSEKEKKHCSKDYVDRLNKYCKWISECEETSNYEGAILSGGEQLLSGDELEGEKRYEFVLNVEEISEVEMGEDGIENEKQFNQKSIEDTAKDKSIVKYYNINLTKKDSEGGSYAITSVARDTDTTGKVRITMDIPEEHRGHKHYHFVHIHNGEPMTLVDLDDNPDTITFEIDRFSTFALTYTDNQLAIDGDIEEEIEKKSIVLGSTMTLANSLTMSIYLNTAESEPTDKVVVEHIFKDGRTSEKIEKLVSECDPSDIGGNMYMIKIDTIAAKEMSDEIKVTVYNAEGIQKSVDYTTSVREYAMRLFETTTDENLKKVVVNMLNYGAAAQDFFGYNEDDMANKLLTDEMKTYASEKVEVTTDTMVKGKNFAGTTLTLESNIILTGYFAKNDADVSKLSAKASFTDHYGNAKTQEIGSDKFNMSLSGVGYFGVDVTEVVVADLKQPVTVTVTDEEGSVYGEATFSIENYIAGTGSSSQAVVSEELAKFAMSAYNYFR